MTNKKIIPTLLALGGVGAVIYFLTRKTYPLMPNIVLNPGFEEADDLYPAEPKGWYENGDDTHLATWCDAVSHSGNKSLRMDVLDSTKSWYRWTGEDIVMKPNTTYIIEYWYKAENLPPKTGAESGPEYDLYGYPTRAMMELSWFDGISPNRFGMAGVLIPWEAGNHEWTKVKRYITTPVNVAYASPRFFLYSFSGTIWFDDLSIREANVCESHQVCRPNEECFEGYCIPLQCAEGYHIENHQCVPN